MKKWTKLTAGMCVVIGSLFVGQAYSDQKDHAGKTDGAKGADAAEAAMMAAWMKQSQPSEFHKHLEAFVGHWNFTTKWRMSEEAPWSESTGTSDVKWILDGRFIYEDVKGSFGEMGPFAGVGITGYDNGQKIYTNVWMDSMNTSMMTSKGTCDASGKVFTSVGDSYDCMTGKMKKTKTVHTVINENKNKLEMFEVKADGSSFKSMEIIYNRG